MEIPCTLRYGPKPAVMIFCLLLCGGAGLFMGNEALNNDRGMLINHIIELDQNGSTAVLWFLTASCAIGTAVGAVNLFMSIFNPKQLVIDDRSIHLPDGFLLNRIERIPFASIVGMYESSLKSQTWLHVETKNGEFKITKGWMPSARDYEDLKDAISERAGREDVPERATASAPSRDRFSRLSGR